LLTGWLHVLTRSSIMKLTYLKALLYELRHFNLAG
jgi:hypothetical protein